MRRIIKTAPDSKWEEFVNNNPSVDFRHVDQYPGGLTAKKKLKMQLLKEQYYLCAYCCVSISNTDSHTDHIVPHCTGSRMMDYFNMVRSCDGYQVNRNTCGHKHDNAVLKISPLDSDCEKRFKYRSSGEIVPANLSDNDAKETIDALNLNSDELKRARKQVIINIEKEFEENGGNTEAVSAMTDKYSSIVNGKMISFAPVALYAINNYLN